MLYFVPLHTSFQEVEQTLSLLVCLLLLLLLLFLSSLLLKKCQSKTQVSL